MLPLWKTVLTWAADAVPVTSSGPAANPGVVEGVLNFLLQGAGTILFLLLGSVVVVGIAFERLYYFAHAATNNNWLLANMAQLLRQSKAADALALCRQVDGALPRVFEVGLLRATRSKGDIEEAMSTAIAEQAALLEKNTAVLGTMAVICPFVGLFGTVIGIMNAFRAVAISGGTNPSVISHHISEALIATAAGLLVAIVCVILFNVFKVKIKHLVTGMQIASTRFIEILVTCREGQPLPEDLLPEGAMPDAVAAPPAGAAAAP